MEVNTRQSIGETLKNRRTERSFTISEVHEATKIAPQTLASLEENRFDAFPNRVYARAFLRDYANFLKLDSEELLRQYEEEIGMEALPRPSRRANWSFIGGVALLVVALALFAGATVYFASGQRARPADERPAVAERPTAPEAAPAPAPKPEPEPAPAAEPARPAEPTESPAAAGPPETTASPTPPAEASKPAVKPAEEKPAPPQEPEKVRVTLRSGDRAVWIRVMKDGKKEYEGMLQANSQASFVGDKSVFVRAGDAGSVRATVNGKNIGPLGKPGQPINRTFKLDP